MIPPSFTCEYFGPNVAANKPAVGKSYWNNYTYSNAVDNDWNENDRHGDNVYIPNGPTSWLQVRVLYHVTLIKDKYF